jgi:hypothetical protein
MPWKRPRKPALPDSATDPSRQYRCRAAGEIARPAAGSGNSGAAPEEKAELWSPSHSADEVSVSYIVPQPCRCVQHQEDVVTRMALENVNATPHRHSGLTEEEIFQLWRAAFKDDDRLIDEVIQRAYDDMISFDRERAETVMSLTIRRHSEAERALRSLLGEMRK